MAMDISKRSITRNADLVYSSIAKFVNDMETQLAQLDTPDYAWLIKFPREWYAFQNNIIQPVIDAGQVSEVVSAINYIFDITTDAQTLNGFRSEGDLLSSFILSNIAEFSFTLVPSGALTGQYRFVTAVSSGVRTNIETRINSLIASLN